MKLTRATRPLLQLCLLLVLLLTPTVSRGQALVESVPADAVFYFGWAGTASMGEEYAASTFHDVVELMEPERLAAAWRSTLPMIRQATGDPQINEGIRHATAVADASLRGKMAVYVTPGKERAQPRGGDLPPPGVALLWEPADAADREALLAGLKFFTDMARSPHVELTTAGPMLAVMINAPATPIAGPEARVAEAANAAGGAGGATLSASPAFGDALAALQDPGPMVAYLDWPAVADAMTEFLVSEVASPDEVQQIRDALEALNIRGLGPAIATAGFDGKDWRSRTFVALTDADRGLPSLMAGPALTADDLALPPRGAVWVSLASFDLGQLMDVVRATTQAIGPEVADPFEQALADASGMLGMDVEAQLLRGLGSTWAFYVDPDTAGDGMAGVTLVNPLRDAEGVDRGLRAIGAAGSMALMQAMADAPFKLRVQTQTYDGLAIQTLLVPMLAPSWAIVDGKLVAGLYPQTVLAARDRFAGSGSILDNDAFAALQQLVGTRRLTTLSWVDLPATVDTSYSGLITTETLVTGFAAMTTGQPMPRVLPPLGKLRPHLSPSHTLGWVDDAGWHSTGTSPFPGSSMLAPQAAGGLMMLPFAGSMLPTALMSARMGDLEPSHHEEIGVQHHHDMMHHDMEAVEVQVDVEQAPPPRRPMPRIEVEIPEDLPADSR